MTIPHMAKLHTVAIYNFKDEVMAEVEAATKRSDIIKLNNMGLNARRHGNVIEFMLSQSVATHVTNGSLPQLEGLAYLAITIEMLRTRERTWTIRELYDAVDYYLTKDPRTFSCKKGCSFCCYIQVDISLPEAELLARHKHDRGLVEAQATWSADAHEYAKHPLLARRCPFLDVSQGTCGVYKDRPLPCREHRSASPAILCDTDNHKDPDIAFGKYLPVDLLIAAWYQLHPADSMARQLTKIGTSK